MLEAYFSMDDGFTFVWLNEDYDPVLFEEFRWETSDAAQQYAEAYYLKSFDDYAKHYSNDDLKEEYISLLNKANLFASLNEDTSKSNHLCRLGIVQPLIRLTEPDYPYIGLFKVIAEAYVTFYETEGHTYDV